jgi:hypothetical protein
MYRDFLGMISFSLATLLTIFIILLAGCSGAPIAPSITTEPRPQSIAELQTATFSVQATGTGPLHYQWLKNGKEVAGATSATYSTGRIPLSANGELFSVAVTNASGKVTSSPATLVVNPGIDVPTYHYENMRMGQNINEKQLSVALVNSATFGKLGSLMVDGLVDGQPLYLSNVAIPNVGPRNVLYAVTEHGSVFAFDADSVKGDTSTFLWMTSTLLPGETTSDDRDCSAVTPEIGITSTPVIDRIRGAIYVVAASKNSSGNYYQRLHALDLTTGKELFGGPTTISATYPGTGANSANGSVAFDPTLYLERAALTEVNGNIYTTWASHCDLGPYTSWVIAYNVDTLKMTSALNLVPNGNKGGIWMSGGAPGVDASGNIYFIIGNGDFDTTLNIAGFPSAGDCGNCFVKLSSTTPVQLLDYFTPANTVSESDRDYDFGSGGPLLLPDVVDASGKTRHLAVGAGKDVNLYVVDRDNMGKFSPNGNNIYQEIVGGLYGIVFSKPSYFNGTVYYGSASDSLKAFPIISGKLASTASSQSVNRFGYPGETPTISANGKTDGVVWVVENGAVGVLRAYDATNLATELYDSKQAAGARDQFAGNKYITPVVANGKVYVGSRNSVAVFGLLP